MGYRVRFMPVGVEVDVEEGSSLLDAARKAGVFINSVCGGEGVCGKCRVRLLKGEVVSLPSAYRMKKSEQKKNCVLACRSLIRSDVTVEVSEESSLAGSRILMDEDVRFAATHMFQPKERRPLVRRVTLSVEGATIESPIADYERLRTALRKRLGVPDMPLNVNYEAIRQLGQKMRQEEGNITVTVGKRQNSYEILSVEDGEDAKPVLGVAVDVGTTTVVVHLVDLSDGRTLGMDAKYNSQMAFGEDYITRAMHACRNEDVGELQHLVLDDINELIGSVCRMARRRRRDIYGVVTAGNTAMLHFLLGLDPCCFNREPFAPVANFIPPLRASRVGIRVHPSALLYPLPTVAAYVGADITAGVVSVGMDGADALSLFIDIGTNGEVVLGNKDFLVCCSCSAGPAFEGSGVECGMRATEGAIESVRIRREDGEEPVVEWATIGDKSPLGICGSGLIDTIAALFCSGVVERTGKFNRNIATERLFEEDGVFHFVLADEGESGGRRKITISEVDIANLLRSKAAVYAAVKMLLKQVDMPLDAVEKFYLAGGFGNYINIANAITVGMLPDVPHKKIDFAGNTSVAGAKIALLSEEAFERVEQTARRMTYIDLMMNVRFMDEFVKANFIPHTDIDEFPSVCIPEK